MSIFIEATIVATAGLLVTGLVSIAGMLTRVSRDLRSIGPSMQALYAIQPYIIKATRFQNAALKELGANGSTVRSDACLDEAEAALDRRLAERVGGCA